ncbi:MAG: CopG family transcriptional regulator [Comamonadaceae bacterium CG1_02_60_18]|nr:MAG: CopG family transcriptional regulator [Comamonadaceae bacterium CG1_02_60_18]PIQ52156.1 MAG: CopG family transcriptional regulator [Comamonadaceae bacterium CG12_big_fil_rev_8_21_14_0_65_59_15]
MRTTLAIDDDVFAVAKRLAADERQSVGSVLSALARQALKANPQTPRVRNGVPLLSVQPVSAAVTPELIKQLQDDLP